MNDLAQIKRQNERAARAQRFPLRVGNYRIKSQQPVLYHDRHGTEYRLSPAATSGWVNSGTVPETTDLIKVC